jgi:hypothetical protein
MDNVQNCDSYINIPSPQTIDLNWLLLPKCSRCIAGALSLYETANSTVWTRSRANKHLSSRAAAFVLLTAQYVFKTATKQEMPRSWYCIITPPPVSLSKRLSSWRRCGFTGRNCHNRSSSRGQNNSPNIVKNGQAGQKERGRWIMHWQMKSDGFWRWCESLKMTGFLDSE